MPGAGSRYRFIGIVVNNNIYDWDFPNVCHGFAVLYGVGLVTLDYTLAIVVIVCI